jgi:predicted porin
LVLEHRFRVVGRSKRPNTGDEILASQHFGDYEMRKTQMALAAVALVASTAVMANGVTVSGRIDYGYASDNGATSKQTGLQGGLLAPNFFNVAGSEDLGGGLKASFNWSNIIVGGGIANAQSWVGVDGEMGGIKLGKVVDSFWGSGVANFDVTGGQNIGSAVSPVIQLGASNIFQAGAVQANANVAGVSIGATYVANSAGQTYGLAQADNTLGGATVTAETAGYSGASGAKGDYSIAATTDLGPVKLGAGSSRLSLAPAADTNANEFTAYKHWFVGAGTTIGSVAANGLYMKLHNTTVAGLNGSIPLADAVTAHAAYYDYSDSVTPANGGSMTVIGAKYALSKSTSAFGNYQKVSGGAQAMVGQPGGTAGLTARSIFILGVAHSF